MSNATKIITLAVAMMLSACATTKLVPVYTMPTPDPSFMEPGQPLQQIQKPQTKTPATPGATASATT